LGRKKKKNVEVEIPTTRERGVSDRQEVTTGLPGPDSFRKKKMTRSGKGGGGLKGRNNTQRIISGKNGRG